MKQLARLERKAWVGVGFIYLAGLGWLGCVIVPFLDVSHKVAIVAALLIAAELSFIIGVALLGKAYYKELKERLFKALGGRERR